MTDIYSIIIQVSDRKFTFKIEDDFEMFNHLLPVVLLPLEEEVRMESLIPKTNQGQRDLDDFVTRMGFTEVLIDEVSLYWSKV